MEEPPTFEEYLKQMDNLHDVLNRKIASKKLDSKTAEERKKAYSPSMLKKRIKNRKANKRARKQRRK